MSVSIEIHIGTNENHNSWTLTKHLAHSANVEAGKLDKAIYGPKPPPPPEEPMTFGDVLIGIGGMLLFIMMICVWAWQWQGFKEAVYTKLTR